MSGRVYVEWSQSLVAAHGAVVDAKLLSNADGNFQKITLSSSSNVQTSAAPNGARYALVTARDTDAVMRLNHEISSGGLGTLCMDGAPRIVEVKTGDVLNFRFAP